MSRKSSSSEKEMSRKSSVSSDQENATAQELIEDVVADVARKSDENVKEKDVAEVQEQPAETTEQTEPRPASPLSALGFPAELVDNKGAAVKLSDIEAKSDVVGIYFGALSVDSCKEFVPVAAEHYAKHNDGIASHPKKYEVVYISCDKNAEDFQNSIAQQPWLTVKLEEGEARQRILESFNVTGLPTMVLVNAKTGDVFTEEGVQGYNEDRTGANFPWPGLKKSLWQRILPVLIQKLPMILMMLFMFYRNFQGRRELNKLHTSTSTVAAVVEQVKATVETVVSTVAPAGIDEL